jgi:hypothetical protein
MSDKSHVGMGFDLCPVCGAKHNEVVLLDRRLQDSLQRENFMGFSLCPEHAAMEAEYLALVEIKSGGKSSESRLKPEDVHNQRTGKVAHIRRTEVSHVLAVNIPDDIPLIYVEEGVVDALKARVVEVQDDAPADTGTPATYAHHEVCMYEYGEDESGNHTAAYGVSPPLEVKGWTVYVRGYKNVDDEDWDELHDKDFPTEAEATAQAKAWAMQYNCEIDAY